MKEKALKQDKKIVFDSYVNGARCALEEMKKVSIQYMRYISVSDKGYLMMLNDDSGIFKNKLDKASKEFSRCMSNIEYIRKELDLESR